MLDWFRERIDALRETRHNAWPLLGLGLILVGFAWSAIQGWMEGGRMWDVPIWAWGLTLGFIVFFWWQLESVVRLRQASRPNVRLQFLPNEGGLVQTPEDVFEGSGALVGNTVIGLKKTGTRSAIYVRIRVDCTSSPGPRVCAAFLTRLGKSTAGAVGQVARLYDGMQLPWSFIGPREIPVHPQITRHVDVFKTNEEDNKLEVCGPVPLAMADFFSEKGDYVADITVIADGVSSTIRIRLTWNGRWDQIVATIG
jgi:hypothetical protein